MIEEAGRPSLPTGSVTDWSGFAGVLQGMTFLVLVAAMLAAPPQDNPVSSAGVSADQSDVLIGAYGNPPIILPVSLERIRELLALPTPVQQVLARRPTFKIEVEEEHHVQKLLENLDFK